MSSFASAKGPSITVRFVPEYFTRQPLELAWSPEASSSTPAFCSSSWYFCISAMSFSGGITPASEFFVALTIIMNRMLFSNQLGAGPPDGSGRKESLALTLRRTRLREIDSLNELLLVVDRLVGGGPEIAIDRGGDRRIPDALGHEDSGDVLPGVGVPGRAVAAVPAVGPDRAREVVAPRDDGHAEAPAAVVPETGKEIGRRFLFRGDVVGRHQLDRGPREDALAPVHALREHHPAEREEVVDRRDDAARSRLEDGRAREAAAAGLVEEQGLAGREIGLVGGREAVELRLGDAARDVSQTEWRDDALAQEGLQRLARRARNQDAEDVGAGVVHPLLARLVRERQAAPSLRRAARRAG